MPRCCSFVYMWCYVALIFVFLNGFTNYLTSAEELYLTVAPPSTDFRRHVAIQPKVIHGRHKRELSTTREQDGMHAEHLTIGYTAEGTEHLLDLRLNRDLLPNNTFLRYQQGGQHVVNRPTVKDLNLCQYVGVVRDQPGSWAAVSTCHGLSGMVFDGKDTHYIEAEGNTLDSVHYLYRHEDLVKEHKCGYNDTSDPHHHHTTAKVHGDGKHDDLNRILRYKRGAKPESIVRGPYNANKKSRYVELILVVDNKEYKFHNEDTSRVYTYCKTIANTINSLYAPLNIFVALVGVVVWTEYDEISLSNNGDTTLTNFLHYRREKLIKDHPNDNAQLLTREEFAGGVVGKALKGPMCTFEFSGGVAMDHSTVTALVATTMAHEMGHNFGMEHDTKECTCPEDRCIMSPSSTMQMPTHWSSCSLEYLSLAFEHGMDYCLRNKPTSIFDSPVCGNGFVEPGEQCDCGLTSSCLDNHCCNATTCMLYSNATCATGECCDLKTCRPSTAGTTCRSADRDCDLPEHCTGQSEFCPDDVFKMDTEPCDNGEAFCYRGSCRTRSDQCRLLWGPSGENSDDQCYDANKKSTRHGNCGYDRLKKAYSQCSEEDKKCGMLQCRHLNERLEFGMESVAILSHSFINIGGTIIPCRTAIVDLGLEQVDPGLVPDGAKCGEGKMCVKQKCTSISSLRLPPLSSPYTGQVVCPSDCSGNGVCNSLGHCHCNKGFAPPLCELPGPGGSVDSGPASDPNAHQVVMKLMFLFFLGIVPGIALIALLVYYSRHNPIFWWQKSKGAASKSPTKGGIQRRISRGANCLGLCSPASSAPSSSALTSPRLSPDDMSSSLLSPGPAPPPNLHSTSFFGHFKGFTITPIQKQEEAFGVQNQNFGIETEAKSPVSSTFNNSNHNSVKNAVNNINRGANHTAQINGSKNVSAPFGSTPTSPNNSQKFPQRSAPPVPSVPTVTIKIPGIHRTQSQANSKSVTLNRNNTVNAPVARPMSVVTGVENINSTSMAPALPPPNSALQNSRPVISNPILEASTCTAKELISPLKNSAGSAGVVVPLRAAPAAPTATSPIANKRPLSSPNSTVNSVLNLPEEPIVKKPKDGTTTLNRIASFLKQDKSEKDKSRNPVERSNSLPKNPNHQVKATKNLDKNSLRTLQISNPILQKEIELPSSAVPVVSDSEELDDPSKMVIMRAQSMRGPTLAPRPNIPTFGSMRQAPGFKRPTSIPVGNRPTSPPPPRPDEIPAKPEKTSKLNFLNKIPGMPGYQNPPIVEKHKSPEYDDCVAETHAPLANISEETSPDNIYAIIEESPPHNSAGKVFYRPQPSAVPPKPSVPSEYNSPKNISGVNSSSTDSMGLLGEIVSEIQNRNFDSIYSTSTLARKKREKELREKNGILSDDEVDFDDAGTYANTSHYKSPDSEYSNMNGGIKSSAASTTSSGYLNPAAVNVPVGNIPPKSGIISIGSNDEQHSTMVPKPIELEGYKPFSSSLHRSQGPFASSYNKEKNNSPDTISSMPPKASDRLTSPPPQTATKIPPLIRQITPDKPLVKESTIPTLNRQITPPSLKNITQAQRSLQGSTNLSMKMAPAVPKNLPKVGNNKLPSPQTSTNSPDLVSSCALKPTSSTLKSPDVVSSNGQSGLNPMKPSAVNQGVILKPTLQTPVSNKPNVTQLQKPAIVPKTLVKQNSKVGLAVSTEPKSALRSAPPPPAALDKKKTVPPRPNLPKVTQSSTDKNSSNGSLSTKSNSFDKTLNGSKTSASEKQKPPLKTNVSQKEIAKPASLPGKVAASKVSNVANLQQKFEASKAATGVKAPTISLKKV